MATLKESQAKAAKMLKEEEDRVTDRRYRDLDSGDASHANYAKVLRESLGETLAAEWVAGLSNNMLNTIKPGKYETDSKYTMRNFREACSKAVASGKMKESINSSTNGALLTLGVEAIMLDRFDTFDTSYQALAQTIASDADTQVYAATLRPTLPVLVSPGEQVPQSNLQTVGNTVKNYKWMQKLQFTAELVEDDQTGSIAMSTTQAADGMKYIFESWMAGVLLGANGTYGSYAVPQLAFQSYIDSDAGAQYTTTGLRANQLSTLAVVSIEAIRTLETLAAVVAQPDGQILLSKPDTLWYHPYDEFIVETLMKSPTWAGSSNQADSGVNGLTGSTTGSVGATNVLQGKYNLVANRLLPYNTGTKGGAWGLMDRAKQPVYLQEREAIQVIMEAPNAGQSFEADLQQWRYRKRATLFVFPDAARFMFLGNTGA